MLDKLPIVASKAQEAASSFVLAGGGHVVIEEILLLSVEIPSALTMCLKYEIYL